jgi:hypothetical protein
MDATQPRCARLIAQRVTLTALLALGLLFHYPADVTVDSNEFVSNDPGRA